MKKINRSSIAGITLVELLVASVIGGFALAAVFSGAMSMQRCFIAGQEFSEDKKNQSRLIDFLTLDIRRALTITPGTGNTVLTVTIPDFYDESGQPRMPTIVKYVAQYGDPTKPITITYEKNGSSIYRREGSAAPVEIATNVADFVLKVDDPKDQRIAVKTHVSFTPQFSSAKADVPPTTIHSTIFLRNKRTDIK